VHATELALAGTYARTISVHPSYRSIDRLPIAYSLDKRPWTPQLYSLAIGGFAAPTESVDFFLGFVFGGSVSLLELASQLFTLAGHLVQILVGEFSPLLLHFAFELLPIAFYLIPIHDDLHVSMVLEMETASLHNPHLVRFFSLASLSSILRSVAAICLVFAQGDRT
jgi:hypothetical protein